LKKDSLHIADFISYFKDKALIKDAEIKAFYTSLEPEITGNTISIRISRLIKKLVISRIAQGEYILGSTKAYQPVPESELLTLYKKLKKEFPLLPFCVWSTKLLNEFMLHQPFHFFILVETESDATETVFNYLKEFNKEVFFNPDENTLYLYAFRYKRSIIVKNLVTEAPMQTIEKIQTISIEKMLVDIFCDRSIFNAQQGSELEQIFTEAFSKYSVNKTKLIRYASRRAKRKKMNEFLHYLNLNNE